MYGQSKYRTSFWCIIGMMLFTACSSPTKTYEVLLINGGKNIEGEAFLEMFEKMDRVHITEVLQPEANQVYSSPDIEKYDALVIYDYWQAISEEQKGAFVRLLKKGKGMVFLHHSLVSYQDWEEYENIIGGRYYNPTKSADSTRTRRSTYQHDVEIPIHIIDPQHHVTKGISDFIIHDEAYANYTVLPKVHPLLSTTHPANDKIIAWTHRSENSRIVYIQLGHDHLAYENANYQQLVQQAIFWVAE